MSLPNSLEEAVLQAKEATRLALQSGVNRVQVELIVPEIPLQAQVLALDFASLFEEHGEGLRVIFPDTGASMLARRDWGDTVFQIGDLGSRFIPVDQKISEEDTAYLVVCPSSVEINSVEKLCTIAGDRPVVLLIPQLEDLAIVGIGLAARQLRERFISTLETVYYFRPLEGAVVLRSFPSRWQVWLEKGDDYELIAEETTKPAGERLDTIILQATTPTAESDNTPTPTPTRKTGLFAGMGQFLKALRQ
jgi:hypothetical protein